MTQDEDKSLLKFLQEQEAKGYIRPSISPYASPFFFIQKKDGKLRPVQDYRHINNITISNQYPLPLNHRPPHRPQRCQNLHET
jgi:hypothetical protein